MISSIQPKKYQCSICSQLGHNKRTCPLQDAQDSDIFTQRFKAYILNDAETPASNVSDKTEEQYFAEYEEWMTYMNEAVQEIFEQKKGISLKGESFRPITGHKMNLLFAHLLLKG